MESEGDIGVPAGGRAATTGRMVRGWRGVAVLASVVLAAAACAPDPPPPPATAPVVSSFGALGEPHVEPALVPLRWGVTDPQGDAMSCRLDGDGDGTWDETIDPCPPDVSRNVSAVDAGAHTARLEVSDGTNTTLATATYHVGTRIDPEPFDIVIRPSGTVDPDVLAAMQQAATRWERVVARGLGDVPVHLAAGSCGSGNAAFDGVVDDLVVDVSMKVIPPAAWAAPCVDGPDGLPRFGFVEFNPNLTGALLDAGMLDEVAVHELGHVLGFGVTWQDGRDVTGAGGTDPRFSGPRVRAENSLLRRSVDVPVMTVDGVMSPHWESVFLGPEIMATTPDGSALSRLTIASLADIGYAVDMRAADPYSPPLPAGTCIAFSATVTRCW